MIEAAVAPGYGAENVGAELEPPANQCQSFDVKR